VMASAEAASPTRTGQRQRRKRLDYDRAHQSRQQ
jgi:hypothetical protein